MVNERTEVIGSKNLSGRSQVLVQRSKSENGIYISPQLNDSISGLTTRVKEELKLNSKIDGESFEHLLDEFDLSRLLENSNPHELSGGEKAKLILISSVLQNTDTLCIDCTFEQIDTNSRIKILKSLQNVFKSIYLSDNSKELCDYYTHKAEGCLKSEQSLRVSNICSATFTANLKVEKVEMVLDNLSFFYKKGVNIINNLCYEFTPDKIIEFRGNNGSGKSTLAKILLGLLQVNGGQIKVNGKQENIYREPGKYVSYHFQNPDSQIFSKSVLNELSDEMDVSEKTQLLESFGLGALLNENPFDLPLSIRKRLTLASCLSFDRSWFILDEPTLFQDYDSIEEIAKIILKLKASGKGVIVITHNVLLRKLLSPTVLNF
jgi:energy-coupling factor transporter ATP-binding protein EcfA2